MGIFTTKSYVKNYFRKAYRLISVCLITLCTSFAIFFLGKVYCSNSDFTLWTILIFTKPTEILSTYIELYVVDMCIHWRHCHPCPTKVYQNCLARQRFNFYKIVGSWTIWLAVIISDLYRMPELTFPFKSTTTQKLAIKRRYYIIIWSDIDEKQMPSHSVRTYHYVLRPECFAIDTLLPKVTSEKQ